LTEQLEHFRLCSSCKTPLAFESTYYVCSVSTCNRKRTGLTFCSVACYDAHLPGMRHRSSWAEEERAPSRDAFLREQQAEQAKQERAQPDRSGAQPLATSDDELPREVLIVVSKLKKYIKARSGMNTSEDTMEALSDIVRAACDQAVREAGRDDRRTVKARDFAGLDKFPRDFG